MAQARGAGLGGSPKSVYTPPSAKEALRNKNNATIAKYASAPEPTWMKNKSAPGAPVKDAVLTNRTIATDVNGNRYYTNVPKTASSSTNTVTDARPAGVNAGDARREAQAEREREERDSRSRSSSSSRSSSRSTSVRRPTLPDAPELRSAASMARLMGITHDQGYIEDLMRSAAEEKYANLDVEFGRTQDMFYDAVANNADLLRDTLRRGDRDAVMSGMGSGTQSATELAALLGMGEQNAQGATELAQARGDLVQDREAELAQISVDALKYYNQLGLDLGALSNSELNALVTAYASKVATVGGMYNTDVMAATEGARIDSSERIANSTNLTNREIAELTAKYNLEGTKYATDNAPSYSGGSYSSGGSSSGDDSPSAYEKAGIIIGLYQETKDPALLQQIADLYDITLSEAKKLVDDTERGDDWEPPTWFDGLKLGESRRPIYYRGYPGGMLQFQKDVAEYDKKFK